MAQEKGEESIENVKILISVSNIYTAINDYPIAMKRIKSSLKIMQSKLNMIYLYSSIDWFNAVEPNQYTKVASNTEGVGVIITGRASTPEGQPR